MADHARPGDFRGELVIGLAGALGTRLDDLASHVVDVLGQFDFKCSRLRVSDLLRRFPEWTENLERGEGARIQHHQKVANLIRSKNRDGAMLARAAIAQLRDARAAITGDPDKPADGHAFLISQFKHPDEVTLMRGVYGPAFILVAAHATRRHREGHLAKQIAISMDRSGDVDFFRGGASDLIEADQKGSPDFGQNMQETFPLADVFVDLNPTDGELMIDRYFNLEFGHPFLTPTPEEVAMYQASAVALRSSDFNRQVGAAIVKLEEDKAGKIADVEILALGMNEVPKAGGGYYWGNESPDCRDQARGEERAKRIKLDMLTEIVDKMRQSEWLGDNQPAGDLARELLPGLKGTKFAGISEFSRPVHAEVAAIIDAARRGVQIDGSSLFVTTFPCHNCAKHIIATGIRKVVYLEPYPKSQANSLYEEELSLDTTGSAVTTGKVEFEVYSGVAPRKYRTLFSMLERGARQGLTKAEWEKKRPVLRPLHVPPFLHGAYCLAEVAELAPLGVSGFRELK